MSALLTGLGAALLATALLRMVVGVLERSLPPATLVRLLSAGALVTATSLGFILSSLALAIAGRNDDLAEAGRWSVAALRELLPVPWLLGAAAGLVVTVLAANAVRVFCGIVRDLVCAARTGRSLPSGPVVVLDDPRPEAYTLGGLHARVVVSTGMLRALPAAERAVLLAHELSHLRHRHHVYPQLVELAAAANPALWPLIAAVRHGVERWADEDAARSVGDRTTAARAIARAGLVHVQPPAMSAGGGRVADRAQALLRPPPRSRTLLTSTMLVAVLAVAALSVTAAVSVNAGFELAQQAAAHR